MKYEYTTKAPARGDAVIDLNLTPPNRGEIVSGVFDMTNNGEVFSDCFVRYGIVLSEWYSAKELKTHWVMSENAYVLNASF